MKAFWREMDRYPVMAGSVCSRLAVGSTRLEVLGLLIFQLQFFHSSLIPYKRRGPRHATKLHFRSVMVSVKLLFQHPSKWPQNCSWCREVSDSSGVFSRRHFFKFFYLYNGGQWRLPALVSWSLFSCHENELGPSDSVFSVGSIFTSHITGSQ